MAEGGESALLNYETYPRGILLIIYEPASLDLQCSVFTLSWGFDECCNVIYR